MMQVAKLNRKNVGKKFFCSPSSYSYKNTKQTRIQEIKKLREIYQQEIFNEQLKNGTKMKVNFYSNLLVYY